VCGEGGGWVGRRLEGARIVCVCARDRETEREREREREETEREIIVDSARRAQL